MLVDGPFDVLPAWKPIRALPMAEQMGCVDKLRELVRSTALAAALAMTAGCGGGYCPKGQVTRGQMAVFLVGTFALTVIFDLVAFVVIVSWVLLVAPILI